MLIRACLLCLVVSLGSSRGCGRRQVQPGSPVCERPVRRIPGEIPYSFTCGPVGLKMNWAGVRGVEWKLEFVASFGCRNRPSGQLSSRRPWQ